MKIRVDKKKIIEAVRKLEGIEIVLESEEDAREALDLIMAGGDLFNDSLFQGLKEIRLSEVKEYKTSSVNYEVYYLMEFVFDEKIPPRERAEAVKRVQVFFEGR